MKDFNFFSFYIKAKKKARKKDYTVAGVFLIAVIIAVSFTTYFMIAASNMEKEIAKMEQFINDPEHIKVLNEVNNKREKMKIIEEYNVIMEETQKQIKKSNRIHTKLLNEITSTLPQALFFSMLTLTNEELHIQGVSDARTHIAELEYNLRQVDRFEKIHVSIISKDEETNRQIYDLKAILKDGDIDENEKESEN